MENSPTKLYSFTNIGEGISKSYNTHIQGPISKIDISNNIKEFSDTQNSDIGSSSKKDFFHNILNLFNNPIAKKILSIFIIILLTLILIKVSINNVSLSNSTTYFLNQCMWVWAIMLLIIIIINLFGFIK